MGYLDLEQRARVSRRSGGLPLPVRPPVIRRRGKRPFVELAERQVARALAVCVSDSRGTSVGVGLRDEPGRAHVVDDGLDPRGSRRASCVKPSQGVVDVVAAQRDALGEEGRDGDRGGGLVRSLKQLGAGCVVDRVLADDGFESREGPLHGGAELVRELVQLARKVRGCVKGRDGAQGDLARAIQHEGLTVRSKCARRIVRSFRDEPGYERSVGDTTVRLACRAPSAQEVAHAAVRTVTQGELEVERRGGLG